VRPVERIAWNTTTWVDSIERQLGGNGASTCYTLGKLGVPVRLIGLVGRDGFGDELLDRLASVGVDLGAVGRSQLPTATTVALVNSQGDRFLLHRPGASAEAFADPLEFPPTLREGLTHFHLANAFALPHLRRQAAEALRRARAAGLTTSVDTGWDPQGRWLEDLGPCLPNTDCLFANEEEACKLGGLDDASAAARRLLHLGARSVVLKLGAQGCGVFGAQAEIHLPAFEVQPVDTTGAGDCFVGAFLAALHRGRSDEAAGRFANAVAALSVQQLGGTAGLLSYNETVAWMERAKLRR
jgi:sugar/nucleoside kinase (ribokinase family)